jgi:putative hydrolase of the HAD superfamily
MKRLTSILFDLDDTLILEKESAIQAFLSTIRILPREIIREDFVSRIFEEARKLWYSYSTLAYAKKVGISSWEALWAEFSGGDPNLKILASVVKEYRFNSWNNALIVFGIDDEQLARKLSQQFMIVRNIMHVLYPDSLPALEKLKQDLKLGLITNGAPDIQWKKIRGGKLESFFHAITISGEYGIGKPDPRLFHAALSKLKSEPDQAIMIGDSLKSDIKGAKETGIPCIWINRKGLKRDVDEPEPDFEIADLNELYAILELFNSG